MAMFAGCDSGGKLPGTSSAEYRNVVSAFYVGLAALQVGDDAHADDKLAEMVRLAPGEPAGWANWGVLALRQRNFDAAAQRLERARDLAPKDAHLYSLLGILESNRGRSAEAIAHLRKAVDLNPHDLRSRYAWRRKSSGKAADSDAEFQQLIEKILATQPDNLAALLELSHRGETRRCRYAEVGVARIGARSAAWPPEVQQQLRPRKRRRAAPNVRAARCARRCCATRSCASPSTARATRRSRRRPAKMRSRSPVSCACRRRSSSPRLRIWPSTSHPRRCGSAMAPGTGSAPSSLGRGAGASRGEWQRTASVHRRGASVPRRRAAKHRRRRKASCNSTSTTTSRRTSCWPAPAACACSARKARSAFTDVTARPSCRSGAQRRYTGAWAVDIEADGDLDIVLGTSEGAPVVLRNNGDGTFVDIRPFAGVSGVRQFAWADLDGDGNPDAAIIDAAGRFTSSSMSDRGSSANVRYPPISATIKAIAVADANNDGVLDLAGSGRRRRGSAYRTRTRPRPRRDGNRARARPRRPAATRVRLRVADLDNNGAIDLYLAPVTPRPDPAGALIWLGNEKASSRCSTIRGAGTGLRRGRPERRRQARSARSCRGTDKAVQAINRSTQELSLASRSTARRASLRRPAHQPVRRRRRNRNPLRPAGAKAADHRTAASFRDWASRRHRRRAGRLAEWRRARRVRRESRSGSRDRATSEGIVSVPVRLQRQADGVREGRGSVGFGDRLAHQYAWLGEISRRRKSGTRSDATSSCRATAITTCASRRNYGRSITTIISR